MKKGSQVQIAEISLWPRQSNSKLESWKFIESWNFNKDELESWKFVGSWKLEAGRLRSWKCTAYKLEARS